VAGAYANVDTARRLLGWEPKLSIEQAIADALQWGRLRREILGYD
jgi:UDP-glucose 4-epimerase